METLEEIPPDPPAREHARIVPAVIILLMLILGYGVTQFVINSVSQRMARASRQLDALAQTNPTITEARAEFARLTFVVSERMYVGPGVAKITCFARLSPSRIDQFRIRFHKATGWWSMPEFPKVGELDFGLPTVRKSDMRDRLAISITSPTNDGAFLGGYNFVTESAYNPGTN